MQVYPNQLEPTLKKGLAPVYIISGEETLVVQECADAIRAAARQAGCTEREVIDIKDDSDWQQLLQSGGSMSLFADKKLVEVRIPSGKPGREGSKALLEYLELGAEDILLVVSGKLDKASMNAKWYKALDQAGVSITAWPIEMDKLPRWIAERLKAAGFTADREAVQILAEKVEGNLLAAKQEVEKLCLLAESNHITVDEVVSCVLDNARYTSFGLIDVALNGDAKAAVRTIRGLQAEATAAPAVLWALAKDSKVLAQIILDRQDGVPVTRALEQRGIWRKRQPLFQNAINRHNSNSAKQLLELCYQADAATKGFGPGDPWHKMESLVTLLALGPQQGSGLARR